MATKATQRPCKAIIEIFDDFLDINGNNNFKRLMKYRFFGTKLPPPTIIDIFLKFDATINKDLADMDKIYFPLLRIERKLIFEHTKYKNEVASKKMVFKINWNNEHELQQSIKPIINGLKTAKKKYNNNKLQNINVTIRRKAVNPTDKHHHDQTVCV